MSTLHLVFSRAGYEACKQRCRDDDPVLLLQDGVYADTGGKAVLALESDSIARGMHNRLVNVAHISMDQFVELTTQHKPVVSWR